MHCLSPNCMFSAFHSSVRFTQNYFNSFEVTNDGKSRRRRKKSVVFEDCLPMIAEKLGEEGLMRELCNGFHLVADAERGVIIFHSLKKNAALFACMESIMDEELWAMIEESDLDGDGALDLNEFCVLMFRLSPSFMAEAQKCLQKTAIDIIHTFDFDGSVRDSVEGWGK